MNRCVPEFETEEDCSIPSSSGLTRPKTIGEEEEIMELLWKNGQVVAQTQNQRPPEKTTPQPQLLVQDDEMTSWLQYPLDDFCTDLWPPPPSAGDSGGSASASLPSKAVTVTDDRKRKGREEEVTECESDNVEFESADGKKQVCGSTSSKKSRAAEVHNLSERRRRDRINEKMKALQELVPRSNKSDKASMLDEAIEYLKTLQLQVQQMMSMGCSMVPVMFPGVQQYVQPMGMGMGLSIGMNRPMVPFLPGSAMQNPAAATHLGPRFPVPTFPMPPVPGPDPSRITATHMLDPRFNPLVSQNPNQQQIPNFTNAYQQYLGLHQARVPLPQNQAVVNPSTSKPCSSREVGNPENH